MGTFIAWCGRLLADSQGVPDEARVGFMLGILAYLGYWAYWLLTGHAWDAMTFGGGMVSIVTGYGVALRARGSN